MDTASSSSDSDATPSTGVDEALALETGLGGPATVKSLEEAARKPWWQQTRALVILGLVLLAGAGAAAALAVFAGMELKGADSSPSSSNSGSTSDNEGTVTSPPTELTSPVPEQSPPPTAMATEPSPTVSPTSSPTSSPTIADPPTVNPTITATPTNVPSAEPTLSSEPTSTPDGTQESFSFYVMGDTPYDELEQILLVEQVQDMKDNLIDNAVFTIHVGDMMNSARSQCRAPFFESVANTLLQGPYPTLVIPGDNDFLDCSSENQAWSYYYENFVSHPFEQHWFNSTERQAPHQFEVTRNFPNDEMFSFVYNGVLFLSVSLWQTDQRYLNDSTEWAAERILSAFNEEAFVRGVVIFCHASYDADNKPFYENLMELFYDQNNNKYVRRVPVLYIHGDGHSWDINRRIANNWGWDRYWDIQIDQGGKAPPILVEVAPALADNSFIPLTKESPHHYLFGDGLFRIDRRGGRYS